MDIKILNKVVEGNCNDKLKDIPNNYIDLTVTSPPYDSIREYGDNWDLDLHFIGEELFRVTKDGGIVAIVIQDGTKDFGKSLTTFKLAIDWCNIGFKLFETIIYHRHGRPGAWWSKRFRVDHEYILIFLKGKRPRYFNKEPLKIPAKHAGEQWHGTQRLTNGDLIPIEKKTQKEMKCRGTIWFYSASNTEGNKLKMLHPATFPDKLAEDLILCFSDEGDLVFDPMCGSGTTLVAASKNNRKYLGIEIDHHYCEIAIQRLNIEN